jgi:hypothetical protein
LAAVVQAATAARETHSARSGPPQIRGSLFAGRAAGGGGQEPRLTSVTHTAPAFQGRTSIESLIVTVESFGDGHVSAHRNAPALAWPTRLQWAVAARRRSDPAAGAPPIDRTP